MKFYSTNWLQICVKESVLQQLFTHIIVTSKVFGCRLEYKISPQGQCLLVHRRCKCPIYANQCSMGMAEL